MRLIRRAMPASPPSRSSDAASRINPLLPLLSVNPLLGPPRPPKPAHPEHQAALGLLVPVPVASSQAEAAWARKLAATPRSTRRQRIGRAVIAAKAIERAYMGSNPRPAMETIRRYRKSETRRTSVGLRRIGAAWVLMARMTRKWWAWRKTTMTEATGTTGSIALVGMLAMGIWWLATTTTANLNGFTGGAWE